jgi:membrane-associated phospholipid phosphatase
MLTRDPQLSDPTLLRILTILQWVVLVAMAGSLLTRWWYDHNWWTWGMLLAGIAVWWPDLRSGARRWWFFYVAGILLYTILRAFADEAGFGVQFAYPIEVDRWLFRGIDPVVSIQSSIFRPPGVGFIDFFAVQVHWSFFVVPHVAALGVYIWQRELFWRYVVFMLAVQYAALVLFFLLPTAPPWLAARSGELDYVYRVMHFVGRSVDVDTYRTLYTALGEPNSVAAMPSIHMGVTFAVFLWARRFVPRLARILLIYCVLMALSLMYLAEHYAFDLLVGALLAFGIDQLMARVIDQRTEGEPMAAAHAGIGSPFSRSSSHDPS